MGQVGGNTGGIDNIVQGELIAVKNPHSVSHDTRTQGFIVCAHLGDQGIRLEQEGQGLADST